MKQLAGGGAASVRRSRPPQRAVAGELMENLPDGAKGSASHFSIFGFGW